MNFWDERFAQEEYVYGKEPNGFFKSQIDLMVTGALLLPGEGEGRQASYAASLGWEVNAFDSSKEGMQKALKLADEKGVRVQYELATYRDYHPRMQFDVVAMLFTHLPPDERRLMHRRYIEWLRPSGKILLQGFRKEQLGLESGGPKDPAMLWSNEELEEDFEALTALNVYETDEELNEGAFHKGKARLVSAVGIK